MKIEVREPKSCPYCGSTHVNTASKVVDESTYFRCASCGEIWNPARLELAQSMGRGRRW